MTNVLNPNHLEPFAQVICLYVGLQMTSRGILQNTFAKPFIGLAKVVVKSYISPSYDENDEFYLHI